MEKVEGHLLQVCSALSLYRQDFFCFYGGEINIGLPFVAYFCCYSKTECSSCLYPMVFHRLICDHNNPFVVYESRRSLNIALDFYIWRNARLAQSAVW